MHRHRLRLDIPRVQRASLEVIRLYGQRNRPDTEEVTGSNPVAPTTFPPWSGPAFCHWPALDLGRGQLPPPRLAGLPFDADRRRQTTLHATGDGGVLLLVKGAPEVVLARCAQQLDRASTRPLSPQQRQAELARVAELARRGIRVMALARRRLPGRG
jgi:magnesium-transporting ATPase (P-type)